MSPLQGANRIQQTDLEDDCQSRIGRNNTLLPPNATSGIIASWYYGLTWSTAAREFVTLR
ncbi:MAG: hypothetical protein M3247_07355 [Thermoproteota archaeon]|nr:hypothetical protein [Thermoproteota archaeon]